jgi:putative nucleotidyltransferase with HDIG domain
MFGKRAHVHGGPSGVPFAVLLWFATGLVGGAGAALVLAPQKASLTVVDILVLGVSASMVLGSIFRLAHGGATPFALSPSRRPDSDSELHATLRNLAKAAELRDNLTNGHCQRVAFNAERIADCLGLTDRERVEIRWAALLHDVGKAAVPEHILLKPSPLTDEEFQEVKKHSQAGADLIASASSELKAIATLILYHHERWDGQGYPHGLCGSEIPLGARIIAVADVFEALTSERPYRTRLSHSEALATIAAGSGSHFDPDVVAVFGRIAETQSSGSVQDLAARAQGTSTRFKFTSYESLSTLVTSVVR